MRATVILCAALLAGCSSTPFANRLSVSLAGDRVYVNSMYGRLGVTSEVDKRDAEMVSELMRLRARVEVLLQASQQQPPQPQPQKLVGK